MANVPLEDRYGPALGADVLEHSTRFGAWSSRARECSVRLFEAQGVRTVAMHPLHAGFFELELEGVGHGARYAFVHDGEQVRDPYARWLPDGVEAPAMAWRSRHAWQHAPVSRPLREHVIYELHVGAFTAEGTYQAATRKLHYLSQLGVTAIELMPIAAFAGQRGWGYDGVAHFAPFAPYGDPDALRAFIDAAHGLKLSVLLDVVYPWSDAPDFAQPPMRRYVLRNARSWLEEFRFDGLRLDATHELVDHSSRHLLSELSAVVAELTPRRLLIAEDERNAPGLVASDRLDAVWADDFHHQLHVAMTHEHDGDYAAFGGTATEIAQTIEHGWFYSGAKSPLTGLPRGADASALPAEAFIYCLQNHDQIGNRASGDRLTEKASFDAFASASMLLLFLPQTPLLFMGQEWAASTPFLNFTGQAEETFTRSKLDWEESHRDGRSRLREIYRTMLKLRATDPVFKGTGREELHATAHGTLLTVERRLGSQVRTLFINLNGRAAVVQPDPSRQDPRILLCSDASLDWGDVVPGGTAMLVAYEADR